MPDATPEPELNEPQSPTEPLDPSEPSDDEFYFDGPYMVFTEAYHLRRGYCCYSGCRHCPYGFVRPGAAQTAST